MNKIDIIKNFYASDNFRDLTHVEELIDDEIVLDWYSSVGHFKYYKEDILKLSKEMFVNYTSTRIELETIFGEGNEVAVKYKFFAATIENPNEQILIANVMVIWEFKGDKIVKGYQTSFI
jgi:ketosteroid isomerase-like protein